MSVSPRRKANAGRKLPLSERLWLAEFSASGKELQSLAKDKSPEVRRKVAKNPYTPPPVLVKLAGDENEKVRLAVARNPSTPPLVLLSLAKEGKAFRIALAENPSTPPDLLRELAEEGEFFAMIRVAANPSCPKDVLLELARSPEPFTREAVARNPSAPPEALSLLAKDGKHPIREAVAKNPACPPDVLKALILDPDPEVSRAAVGRFDISLEWLVEVAVEASRSGLLPPPLAKRLTYDLDDLPQDPALWMALWRSADEEGKERIEAHPFGRGGGPAGSAWRLSCLAPYVWLAGPPMGQDAPPLHPLPLSRGLKKGGGENMGKPRVADRMKLAQAETSPEKLAKLAKDKSPRVRWAVAKNPHTPPSVLSDLSWDKNEGVKLAVASNPNAEPWVLERLAERGEDFREAVARNPSCPPKLFRKLLWCDVWPHKVAKAAAKNPSCPKDLLLELARHPDSLVRSAVAQNPNTPPEALALLTEDREGYVVRGAASNPACPPVILARLAKGEKVYMRLGVADNPACPPDVLEELARDPDPYVRLCAKVNPQAPQEWVLEAVREKLSMDGRLGGFQTHTDLVSRLLKRLDTLPLDPNLWIALWKEASQYGKSLIEAHPFGRGIALLARLK